MHQETALIKYFRRFLGRQRSKPRQRECTLQLETLEAKTVLDGSGMLLDTPSIDGTEHNVENPDWGSAGVQLLRTVAAEYADGISEPGGEDRTSAREISNAVSAQTESELNAQALTDLFWQWGQFIDHDIGLTEPEEGNEAFNIQVPTGDPFFDPFGTGTQEIGLTRSIYDHNTGDSVDNPRQQINQITAFIDGSMVYGSDDERATELRTFVGGKLKTSDGDLLPFNEAGLANAGGTSDTLFLAGDVRANEQVGLIAMHTLWVREHNRIADQLAEENPDWTDEQLYQRARAIVIAEIQAITYNEFLPALLGEGAIPEYHGYNPDVNPGIANEFSSAVYRFGHSMLSSELLRLNADGSVADEGNISLRDAFFNPSEITDNGIESILRGLAAQQAQEIDTQVVDDVRNFLFGPPGAGGFDLASLNIQRGRDHGLASYNQVRIAYGLDPVTSFDEITSDPEIQAALEAVYGDVENIDLWVGTLAEDHVEGASIGELGRTVIADQFTRLRDGDRFWYQNVFQGRELRQIEQTTLADVIMRNTDIAGLQRNVFFMADAQPEPDRPDRGPDARHFPRGETGRRFEPPMRNRVPRREPPPLQNQDNQNPPPRDEAPSEYRSRGPQQQDRQDNGPRRGRDQGEPMDAQRYLNALEEIFSEMGRDRDSLFRRFGP